MPLNPDGGDVIELRAADPEGDLACDTSIAIPAARASLDRALAQHLRRPIRRLEDGVEARFAPAGWDAVQRYVDLESWCCGFLTLHAQRTGSEVILRVTGRPKARPWIDRIFS